MAFGTGEVIPNPADTLPLDPSTTGRVAVDLPKGVAQNGGRPSRSAWRQEWGKKEDHDQ
jgi:hypothetical protein